MKEKGKKTKKKKKKKKKKKALCKATRQYERTAP
jgi:hypothetical protein